MCRALSFFFKTFLFSVTVLILGNWIHWEGRSISDQVRIGMAHAERSDLFNTVKDWAQHLTREAKKGFNQISRTSSTEEITPSERAKLRALIRELNRSHEKD